MPGKKRKTAATSRRDPDSERELTDAELVRGRVMGRPALPQHKRRAQITMRWAPETIKALKASGPGWTNFAEQAVKLALARRGTARRAKKHGTK